MSQEATTVSPPSAEAQGVGRAEPTHEEPLQPSSAAFARVERLEAMFLEMMNCLEILMRREKTAVPIAVEDSTN